MSIIDKENENGMTQNMMNKYKRVSTDDTESVLEYDKSAHVINEEKESFITNNEKKDVLNEIMNDMGMSRSLIKIIIFGILTCFSDGSEMVVVSLIIRKLETSWSLTPLKKALVGGSIFNGFLIGSLISGKLMDGKGRKFTLVLGSFIFLIFGLTSSFATEFYSFMIFRIGVGFGLGFVIPTTQTFLTELSPIHYRGFNSIIIWLGFPLGEMYICYISHNFPLDDKTYHQENWQIIMILAALPVKY
jgi:MFS family permease